MLPIHQLEAVRPYWLWPPVRPSLESARLRACRSRCIHPFRIIVRRRQHAGVRFGVARNRSGCTGPVFVSRLQWQTATSAAERLPHRHSAWPGPRANVQTRRSASHEVCGPFSACRPRRAGSEMPTPTRCRFGGGCLTWQTGMSAPLGLALAVFRCCKARAFQSGTWRP
jgi:hypothetical protein